jgi:hypothetical protein
VTRGSAGIRGAVGVPGWVSRGRVGEVESRARWERSGQTWAGEGSWGETSGTAAGEGTGESVRRRFQWQQRVLCWG